MINFKETLEKLENSSEFKDFKKENPHSFLTAGFFVIDNESQSELRQLDYATGSGETKELITFIVSNDSIQNKKEETIRKEKFHKLEVPKIELNDAIEIMKKETKEHTNFFSKIIAILQMTEKEGKLEEIWNLTCLSGFNMFRLHIDAMTGKIFIEQNNNILDMMKVEKGNKNKAVKEEKAKEGANYVG
jgi:hypothetical protein